MMSFVWMKVTNDEYELPVAVADSAEKLARLIGAKAATIYSAAWQQKKESIDDRYINAWR